MDSLGQNKHGSRRTMLECAEFANFPNKLVILRNEIIHHNSVHSNQTLLDSLQESLQWIKVKYLVFYVKKLAFVVGY